MLEREGAPLYGHLASAGERRPVAAEAIITSRAVDQDPVVWIGVILRARSLCRQEHSQAAL